MSLSSIVDQLQKELNALAAKISSINAAKAKEAETKPKNLHVSILDLKLSVRAKNALYKSGVDTVVELCSLSRDQLLKTPQMGHVCVEEVEKFLLQEYNIIVPEGAQTPPGNEFVFNVQRRNSRLHLTHKDEIYKRTHVVSDYIADKVKWDWSKSQADLAKEHGYTRERVRQIRNKLIAAGLLDMAQFTNHRQNASFKFWSWHRSLQTPLVVKSTKLRKTTSAMWSAWASCLRSWT